MKIGHPLGSLNAEIDINLPAAVNGGARAWASETQHQWEAPRGHHRSFDDPEFPQVPQSPKAYYTRHCARKFLGHWGPLLKDHWRNFVVSHSSIQWDRKGKTLSSPVRFPLKCHLGSLHSGCGREDLWRSQEESSRLGRWGEIPTDREVSHALRLRCRHYSFSPRRGQ